MATFTLNIYGTNDEIIKTYRTEIVRWGVFMQALAVNEKIASMGNAEKFLEINEFIKKIFGGITDEELENADGNDVFNTFRQLVNKAQSISAPNNAPKNATGGMA